MTDDELRKLAEAALEQDKAATLGPLTPRYEKPQPWGGGDTWHVDSSHTCIACDLSEGDATQFAAARTREPELARAVLDLLRYKTAVERALHPNNFRTRVGAGYRDAILGRLAKQLEEL